MLRKLFNITILLLAANAAMAQELNVKVKVLSQAILNVDKQVFTTMEKSISDFMNTRKWTSDEYNINEKIDVNIMINLTAKTPEDDIYTGTINVQASRPVYNASYTSPTVNYLDRDFMFKYSQFTPLVFDDNRVVGSDPITSNLPAVLAYYAYIIIGLDYDSFAPRGGEDYFKKAQNIVNNAPEQGKAIAGWKAVEGNRNRYWLVDQLLSPRFLDVRSYWYTMHREGFDKMWQKPEEGRQKVLDGIPKLHQVNKDNPMSMLMQFFFNAKSTEFVKIISSMPKAQRAQYITMLSALDVPNSAKYQSLNR